MIWVRGSDADGVSGIALLSLNLTLTRSLAHSPTRSLARSRARSLAHSLTRSRTHLLRPGRVELFALLLARHNTTPAIIVKGGDSSPYMISPMAAVSRAPGFGTFTCCSRNHVMTDEHGVEKAIPCKWMPRRE